MTSLRISELNAESPMQVSKWLKIQALLDFPEITALFETLGDFSIYMTSVLTPIGQGILSKEQFLATYKNYIEMLKNRQLPPEDDYKTIFSGVASVTPDLLYAIPMENGKQLIRTYKPGIQLQAHSMDYTLYDGKFRPMVFGKDSILWGLQFSYPQLYLDPKTKQVFQVGVSPLFPNTSLFHQLQKWIRENTVPTPFYVENRKINVPMRLGKQCFPWINKHPQLLIKNIRVGNFYS